MFGNRIGVENGVLAPLPEMKFQVWRLREFAFRLAQFAFVGAAVILFAIWLMFPNGRLEANWGFAPGSNCESFGRGGTRCLQQDADEGATGKSVDPAVNCRSLGRGGRVCPDGAAN